MKKRMTAMLVIFAMVLTFLPIVPTPVYGSGRLTVYSEGNPVESVMLLQNEMRILTAVSAETGSADYQWQILVEGLFWVDIEGEDDFELELSYAMVASALSDGDTKIRCRTIGDEADTYSGEIGVRIDYRTDPEVQAEPIPSLSGISYRKVLSAAAEDNEREKAEEDASQTETEEAAGPSEETKEHEEIPEEINSSEIPLNEEPKDVEKEVEESQSSDDKDVLLESEMNIEKYNETILNEPLETQNTYSIIISYVFQNGEQAANTWTAIVAEGSDFSQTIASPAVVGYAPDPESVTVDYTNITEDKQVTVTYYPAQVEYRVRHYRQNLSDDNYSIYLEESKTGYTESPVGENMAKSYEGFFSLLYDSTTEIAADGSTIVEIYYDRYYYLMTFNLNGGYGVEPIYARYESPISIQAPLKAGYAFTGWNHPIPSTMPVGGGNFSAIWEVDEETKVTVVLWGENANDEEYSFLRSEEISAVPGAILDVDSLSQGVTSMDNELWTYADSDTITVAADGTSILNIYYDRVTFTLSFEVEVRNWWWSSWTTIYTINEKWGADISAHWPIEGTNGNTYDDGERWDPIDSDIYDEVLVFLSVMPAESFTLRLSDVNYSTYIMHYMLETLPGNAGTLYEERYFNEDFQVSANYNFITYEEDFFDLEGFTQWRSNPAFTNGRIQTGGGNVYFYYTRNQYQLRFYNYNAELSDRVKTIYYQESLSAYQFEPTYPENLEPNGYVFDGWYTSPFFIEASRVDFAQDIMPSSDFMLYAHWVPKEHTVKTYLTSEMDEQIGQTQTVLHGSIALEPEEPINGQYTFVGWFYRDGNTEKAFDFSMPVNRDLVIYAKWSSNVLMAYTVRFELEDGTLVADEITGSTLAGNTRTFQAKAGEELYEGYQSGYFPMTNSHSLTIDIEDPNLNQYTFIYVPRETVGYTVRYLEFGTEEKLHPLKAEVTANAVITENFQPVSGYIPDAYQKRLVLSADETQNVLTFWYAVDEIHAPVQVIHYIQNIAGDDYTEYQTITDLNGIIGEEYSTSVLELHGFAYREAAVNGETASAVNGFVAGTVAQSGLLLEIYYDRILYPYEFRYLLQGTDQVLAEPHTGTARYGAQVQEDAAVLPGYTAITGSLSMIIQAEEGLVAENNVRTFYYMEQEVTLSYEVVGPPGETAFAILNRTSEQVKVMTGVALGATATAQEGYIFQGWYYDEACQNPVTEPAWLLEDTIRPQKTMDYDPGEEEKLGYEEATYYAKFGYRLVDLIIHKTGAQSIDENQSFIFHLTGTDGRTSGVDFKVVISIGVNETQGSLTITNLPVGDYTVTEEGGWSFRYTADSAEKHITLHHMETNSVTFSNTRTSWKWLNGASYIRNSFNAPSN